MGGLKLYVGLAAACVGLLVASIFLPATSWIYRSAYWIGSEEPVDYGATPEANFLEARDQKIDPALPAEESRRLRLERNERITRMALEINTPGAISIAMRTVGQGTVISSTRQPDEAMKKLARLQIQLSQAGWKLDPDNSFWPVMQAVGHRILGERADEDKQFATAAKCSRFDDHAFYEGRLRGSLLENVRGRLGSQQEVDTFASILLPHFASIKALCRERSGTLPLAKSVRERAEIARFSITMTKTTGNLIGHLVGLACGGIAVSQITHGPDGFPRKGVPFTEAEIRRDAGREAEVFLTMINMRENLPQIQQDSADSEDDWNSIFDVTQQMIALQFAGAVLFTVGVMWLGRRLAGAQKSEKTSRALWHGAALLPAFVAVVVSTNLRFETSALMMFAIAAVTGFTALAGAFIKSEKGTVVLLSAHAIVYAWLGLSQSINAGAQAAVIVAGCTPLIAWWSRRQTETLQAVVSWSAWMLWMAAVVFGAAVIRYTANEFGTPYSYEPALSRLLWFALTGILGGVGAGCLTAPGAKGLWRKALVVQSVVLLGLIVALGMNIRRDKTMALYIPNELGRLEGYKEAVTLPPQMASTP